MIFLFVTLIIIASVILGFIVLVQNPKGGGLAGNVGGISNQYMGVKQTTDVLEKGTWIFATVIALLCLFSAVFIPREVSSGGENMLEKVNTRPTTAPATTTPLPVAPTPAPATAP